MTADTARDVPTIADVARAAGVSTATVSRCLNSPDVVQPDTRTRVLDAIQTLGYTPNFGARALVARRTNTIGAIIPTMENAIFARGLQAFQEALNQQGMTMLVASSLYRQDLEARQITNLVARGIDGLLLIGYQRDSEIYDSLDRRGIKTVTAWSFEADTRVPTVGFDNLKAMQDLAREVIRHGHRRLAMISAETTSNDRARRRVEGVRAALSEAGLSAEAMPVIETTYSIDHAGEAFDRLMAIREPPTAVLCGNDVLAVGAILQAKRKGLRVPDDVSITGFDDIELATVVQPELTTVHVPHRAMGHCAATTLLAMIDQGKLTADSVQLDTALRIRASLGKASQS